MRYSIFIIIGFVCLFKIDAGDGNLMPNPDCEKVVATASKDMLPENGWGFTKSCGKFKYKASSEEAHSGAYSLSCEIIQKNKEGRFEMNLCVGVDKSGSLDISLMQLAPDTVYYVSFWAKAKGSFIFYPRYYEWSEASLLPEMKHCAFRAFYPDGKWKKFEWVFTTSPDMKNAVPAIKIINTILSKEGDTVYFDDVEIIPFQLKYPNVLPLKIEKSDKNL